MFSWFDGAHQSLVELTMLPKITNNTLAVKTEYAFQLKTKPTATQLQQQQGGESRPSKMPIIPPRLTQPLHDMRHEDDKPSWYCVISPRETRGLAGPFSVLQLKQMFRVGTVTDKTLVWREGEDDWMQLINQNLLRSQLINLPIMPPRIGKYNAELAVFDPVLELPPTSLREEHSKHFKELETTRDCYFCGGMALYHLPPGIGITEQMPDLYKTREEVGTTEFASEILPGFLWVGTSKASKHRSILTLGLTLLINVSPDECTSPHEQLPYFRCKELPLKSSEQLAHHHNKDHHNKDKSHSTNQPLSEEDEIKYILSSFEKLYDWIEWERKYSDRNKLSDKPAKPYRGPVDEFGFPIKTSDDKPFRRPNLEETDGTPLFLPRVLVYSKNGFDRSCAVGLSYLIKNYGITLQRGMETVLMNRPTMKLSHTYINALKLWSLFYATGIFLCIDCKDSGKRKIDDLIKLDSSIDGSKVKGNKTNNKKKKINKKKIQSGDDEEEYYSDDDNNSDADDEGKGNDSSAPEVDSVEGVPGDDEGSRQYQQILAIFKLHVPKIMATMAATAAANAAAAQGHAGKQQNLNVSSVGLLPPLPNNYSREIDNSSIASANTAQSTVVTVTSAASDLQSLQDVRNFFTPIPRTYFEDNHWTKLIDIDIADRQLSDMAVAFMFQLLTGLNVMKNIRQLSVRNNKACSLAFKALLVGLFPKENTDPDDVDYLEDQYAIDIDEDYPQLMSLDISHCK